MDMNASSFIQDEMVQGYKGLVQFSLLQNVGAS
jgi:hypothetical protein